MFDQILKHADLPVRTGLSAIFIFSGIGKIAAFAPTQG